MKSLRTNSFNVTGSTFNILAHLSLSLYLVDFPQLGYPLRNDRP